MKGVVYLLVFITLSIPTNGEFGNCRKSEFTCGTKRCVPLDKFCNGFDDCEDKSDEPPYCTPCNRTYYGEIKRKYDLEIRRPRENRLPFICYLNFTADGDVYGDLIQLSFDTFTVGKFVSYMVDGCPDGYMTLREESLPYIGGQWCGSAWGYTVYYSETNTINLALILKRLSETGIGYNFDFKLSYKFLSKSEVDSRYGNSSSVIWRGNLVDSTYCDRILDGCDRKTCRIQSPNYPGIYPRNITCYYRVEQRIMTKGKQALVAISQKNANKIHIKDQLLKFEKNQRKLRIWDGCNIVHDYLTIYDGMSTEDPILARFCGGGAIPEVVSSGPQMLLEFHTSPYDNPFHPVPLNYLPGFELDVKIIHVDAKSPTYTKDNKICEFLVTDNGKHWGYIENPLNSLPSNTSCKYHFNGGKSQKVWLSFVEYYGEKSESLAYQFKRDCSTRLRIWDGSLEVSQRQKASLVGEFCKNEMPKLCNHQMASNSTDSHACSLDESYVSSGSDFTLEIYLRRGSVFFPFKFKVRYEFVENIDNKSSCNQTFISMGSDTSNGLFASPKNVFYFGRGGNKDLTCIYRFIPNKGEKVQVKLKSGKFGKRLCNTQNDYRYGRKRCIGTNKYEYSGRAELRILEFPWLEMSILRHCFCSDIEEFTYTSLLSTTLEITFVIRNMSESEDFTNFNFYGDFAFLDSLSASDSELCAKHRAQRKVNGHSGEISNVDLTGFNKILTDNCGNYPWLIEPRKDANSFLYVRTHGYELPNYRWRKNEVQCNTANRIIIYPGLDTSNPRVVCPQPSGHPTIQLFSNGWINSTLTAYNNPSDLHSRSFLIEFLDYIPDTYKILWMEITKVLPLPHSILSTNSSNVSECLFRCPELGACINDKLWCDGIEQCPSGFDESELNCVEIKFPSLYITAVGGILILLTAFVLFISWCRYKRHNNNNNNNKVRIENKMNKTHENHGDENGDIYCKRYSTNNTSDLYLQRRDSLC